MSRLTIHKVFKNWHLELDLLKWEGSLAWMTLYEFSLSVKLKGNHKGIYWHLQICGFKVYEINIYSQLHDENTFAKG
jgi:hypothetical protein